MVAHAHRPNENKSVLARVANQRIVERAARLRFAARIPLLCECSDPNCRELILATLDEYWRSRSAASRGYLVLPGHISD